MPTINEQNELIFFDDFSSETLDRSKWNVRVTGLTVNSEQQAYIDSAETLYIERDTDASGAGNSVLVIHPRYRPGFVTAEGETLDFISGRIDTREKMEFTYGSAAARLKLPAGAGLWPAFWAMGAAAEWPENGEIDIMESVGEPDWIGVALHGPGYSGETPLVNKKYFLPQDDATAWHVYSVDWSPDCLLFKIDGELIYRTTRPMVEYFGRWAFDDSKYLILNFALGGVYPLKINGVRAPYLGMPALTVQLIKEDQIRIMVDWVKVERTIPGK
ncbi:MAG: glycoside hydrolase family 16 protein [Chloroflexota bacterium]